MSRQHFLTLQDVLAIHAAMLEKFGGKEGVLDMKLLESALLSPQASWGGKLLNSFPYEVAAAYLISFSRNHAFADGNKRVGSGAAMVFLSMNKAPLKLTADQLQMVTMQAATGKISKEKVAALLEHGFS